jgi:DNA processing protein
LALTPGIGPQRLSALLRRYGSAERVLDAPAVEAALLPGMTLAVARALEARRGSAVAPAAADALRSLERLGAVAITPDDLAYPDAFRLLPDPPYLLFAAGRLELLRAASVALVGTRRPSEHGRRAAAELSTGLANAGMAVVSGMARGIDTAAHAAALEAGGATVGVLGHGIDVVYPSENRALFRRVREEGLLLTEFAPGEGPKAGNFPRRNRLIAALARAVVVVEMGLKSGAQHTVTYALEQGREVMAVPGPIGTEASAGSNQLLKDGARLVTSVEDILEELHGVGASPARVRAAAQPMLPLLTPDEERILGCLALEPRHVDELGEETRLPPGMLLSTLLQLEVKGAVESLPGKQYRRA